MPNRQRSNIKRAIVDDSVHEAAARGPYLRELMGERGLPRNQLAALSGLSNAYIQHVENDSIANVPRENLIAMGVALGQGLAEIDALLARFDRAALTQADIPAFLALAGRMSLSNALHACPNLLYELLNISCMVRAEHVLTVLDRPGSALRPTGYRSWFDRNVRGVHPLYYALIEAVGSLRRDALRQACRTHLVEHYLSLQGAQRYAAAAVSGEDAAWRRAHIECVVALLEERPRYKVLLVDTSPNFSYTLSRSEAGNELTFGGQAAPGMARGTAAGLSGFGTTSPALVGTFTKDLAAVRQLVLDEYRPRPKVISFLRDLALSLPDTAKEVAPTGARRR